MKKFDFAIGNPPYQADRDNSGENDNFATPVYNIFLDAAYSVSDKVEMIHPSRFLFNIGSTPKQWNTKMLNDPHFKIIDYEPDSSKVFVNTDVKGGIVISYRDSSENFGCIGTFYAFPELRSIANKVGAVDEADSLTSMIYTQTKFNLEVLYDEYPKYKSVIGSNGNDRRFRNNIFEKIPIFTDKSNNKKDIRVLGLISNRRVWRYVPGRFVDVSHSNLNKWKVLVPAANGSGAIGEVLSTPLIGEPLIGYTQSFIGIGAFETKDEAAALLKYVKTKFARCMLGILKVTQHNDKDVWRKVPIQDFASNKEVNWSNSIHEIDLQLYEKYALDDKEIDFIESHVKEME